jgi:hypothetical protein
MAQATTVPRVRETGIGSDRKFWKGLTGTFTGFGPPTGSTIPAARLTKLHAIIASRLEELKLRTFEYVTPTRRGPKGTESTPASTREAVALPLKKEKESAPGAVVDQNGRTAESNRRIAVGDTVRIKYLTDDQKTLQITISKTQSDPSQGIVNHETPVAKALLGAEMGDEVEVLVGSYAKPAVVERVIKGQSLGEMTVSRRLGQ